VLADAARFADGCAFALSVSNRETAITHCQILITHPKIFFFPSASTSKSSSSVAVVLVASSPAGCLLGACSGQQPAGVCVPCAEGCRPGANVERQVKLFLTGLFLSELGET
jgi:hypothetical protein